MNILQKKKVQTPETMQETFMSDSEDELGNELSIILFLFSH